jgi:hypothetical protein
MRPSGPGARDVDGAPGVFDRLQSRSSPSWQWALEEHEKRQAYPEAIGQAHPDFATPQATDRHECLSGRLRWQLSAVVTIQFIRGERVIDER